MSTKKVAKKSVAKKTSGKKVAKKAVKKTSVKKAPKKKTSVQKAVKKTAKKKTSLQKKELVYADNQCSFWVTNGQILNSLVALRDALDEMESEVYSYHTGPSHNDFANWVADVLADTKCATELKKAKTPKKAKTIIVRHLKTYSA